MGKRLRSDNALLQDIKQDSDAEIYSVGEPATCDHAEAADRQGQTDGRTGSADEPTLHRTGQDRR